MAHTIEAPPYQGADEMTAEENVSLAELIARDSIMVLKSRFKCSNEYLSTGSIGYYWGNVASVSYVDNLNLGTHYDKLLGAMARYITAHDADSRLAEAVKAAGIIIKMASGSNQMKRSINAMCSLLDTGVSPVMVVAAQEILLNVPNSAGFSADSTTITALKHLLTDAEKQLGAENLSVMSTDIVIEMLRPRLAERFDVPLES